MNNHDFLEIKNISKSFPGVLALDRVNVSIAKGTVHCLVGENGAGKSTLMKILSGVYTPDSGEIYLSNKLIKPSTTNEAIECGISIVHQELNYIPALSVADNMILGRESLKGVCVDTVGNRNRIKPFLDMIGLDIDPDELMQNLSVAQRQMVMIAKAVSLNAKILILDEPTAMLGENESETLFSVIAQLKRSGVTIIYISHRLKEIFRIGDFITVMKDGRIVDTVRCSESNESALANMMVGRQLSTVYPEKNTNFGNEMLSTVQLCNSKISGVSLSVRAGEVLGIAGLVGSGRSELLWSIFGAMPIQSGEINIDGQTYRKLTPEKSVMLGIGLVPEDRRRQGVFGRLSVFDNITCIFARYSSRFNIRDFTKEKQVCQEYIEKIGIKTPSESQLLQNLSGGNQQKVVLSKWLSTRPKVLLLDEPTQGIDVGAKSEMYRLIQKYAAAGLAIILVSSDMVEVINLSNRVLVMKDGKVQAELTGDSITENEIIKYAMGVETNED